MKKYSTGKRVGHIKMEVIPDLKAATEEDRIKNSIDAGADAATDATKSYEALTANKIVAKHKAYEMKDKTMIGKVLPWVHISISNAKRSILDTYHDIKGVEIAGHLQVARHLDRAEIAILEIDGRERSAFHVHA